MNVNRLRRLFPGSDTLLGERLKLISQMMSGQVIFQILGFVTSLLIIRHSTKEVYGTYQIILSIQMLIAAMSASGMMAGYQKIGSRNWEDDRSLSSLYFTATSIRSRIFLVAMVVGASYGFYAFLKAGYTWQATAFYLLISTVLAYPSVHLPFLQYLFLLKKRIVEHQKTSIYDRLAKFLLILPVIFLFSWDLSVTVLTICTIIPSYLALAFAYRSLQEIRTSNQIFDGEKSRVMLDYVKKNWHNSVFYAFKGQISIIILATLGTIEQVASLGALTRFSLVLTMLATVFNSTLGMEVAKERDKAKAQRAYWTYVGVAIGFAIAAIIVANLITHWLLLILGPEYGGLDKELILVLINGFLGVLVSITHNMNTARGWIHYSPILEIPLTIIALVAAVLLFDLTSLMGVIKMGTLSVISLLLLTTLNALHGFKHWDE